MPGWGVERTVGICQMTWVQSEVGGVNGRLYQGPYDVMHNQQCARPNSARRTQSQRCEHWSNNANINSATRTQLQQRAHKFNNANKDLTTRIWIQQCEQELNEANIIFKYSHVPYTPSYRYPNAIVQILIFNDPSDRRILGPVAQPETSPQPGLCPAGSGVTCEYFRSVGTKGVRAKFTRGHRGQVPLGPPVQEGAPSRKKVSKN